MDMFTHLLSAKRCRDAGEKPQVANKLPPGEVHYLVISHVSKPGAQRYILPKTGDGWLMSQQKRQCFGYSYSYMQYTHSVEKTQTTLTFLSHSIVNLFNLSKPLNIM